jgi:hypothetical protein
MAAYAHVEKNVDSFGLSFISLGQNKAVILAQYDKPDTGTSDIHAGI